MLQSNSHRVPAVEDKASCDDKKQFSFYPCSSGHLEDSAPCSAEVRIGIKDSFLITRLERFLLLQGPQLNNTEAPNLSLSGDLRCGLVEKLKLSC